MSRSNRKGSTFDEIRATVPAHIDDAKLREVIEHCKKNNESLDIIISNWWLGKRLVLSFVFHPYVLPFLSH